jgi:hypothetical protein
MAADDPSLHVPRQGEPPDDRPSRSFAIALGVGLAFVLIAASGVTTAVMMGGANHATERVGVAPGGVLELASLPARMQQHYRFAAAHPRTYGDVPCFCGCDAMLDHRSLLDCFVRPDGGWERHASGCGVCIDESEMVRRMTANGSTDAAIRSSVVAAYTTDGVDG